MTPPRSFACATFDCACDAAINITKRLHSGLIYIAAMRILLVASSVPVVQSYNSYTCGSKQQAYGTMSVHPGCFEYDEPINVQFTNKFPHRDDWMGLYLHKHSNNIHSLPWPETNAWYVQNRWGRCTRIMNDSIKGKQEARARSELRGLGVICLYSFACPLPCNNCLFL